PYSYADSLLNSAKNFAAAGKKGEEKSQVNLTPFLPFLGHPAVTARPSGKRPSSWQPSATSITGRGVRLACLGAQAQRPQSLHLAGHPLRVPACGIRPGYTAYPYARLA